MSERKKNMSDLIQRLRDAAASDITLDLTVGNCGDIELAADALQAATTRIAELETDLGLTKVALDQKNERLKQCESALEDREAKLARYEKQPIMLSVVGPIGTELNLIAKPSEPQGETP